MARLTFACTDQSITELHCSPKTLLLRMLKCADGWRHISPLSISSIVVSLWLAGCLAESTLIGWREYYGGGGVGVDRHLCGAQQTRTFDPMLFQYWPTRNGAGPTLKQHWVESSCLLGELSAFWYTPSVSGRKRQHSALCITDPIQSWIVVFRSGQINSSYHLCVCLLR